MPREPIEDHELADELEAADYEWHGPFGREKHRILPPGLFDRILSRLRRPSPVAESTPTDATAVEAERDGDKCACFCPTDECQRVCTLDCPNAGARIPPRQADMADAQKAESTPSPDTEGVGHEQPVAWRWRYVYPGLPVHWTVRQTPIEPRPATEGLVAIEAEPLFLRTAQNTGRDEVLEKATTSIEFGNLSDLVAMRRPINPGTFAYAALDKLLSAIRALSSPPVSTVDEEGGGQ